MYLVGWLCFPTLEKWPFVGDILCFPAVHSSHNTGAINICSMGPPYKGCVCPSVVAGCMGNPIGCQALPSLEAAGHWLAGPDQEVAGCGTPWKPWG